MDMKPSTSGTMMANIKRCRICNAKALVLHSNACTACRIFFNLNAPIAGSLKCPKERKCEIDITTRKACPKCRLDKCFESGMKRKAIKWKSSTSITSAASNQSQSSTDTSIASTSASQSESPLSPVNLVISEQQYQASVITHGSIHLKHQTSPDPAPKL